MALLLETEDIRALLDEWYEYRDEMWVADSYVRHLGRFNTKKEAVAAVLVDVKKYEEKI